ncbi:cGMP-gated cation channel alpha-1-like isoform X2 [Mercenaria mercenaria]|uniref:cGMP-gated cation channel alpha-1-like isoform X2 n=1 Tax=Mercenaria mercenaria TaxID=6596 RepID=UPI00234E5A35|nr:cGMP-gated cation channel alpha-1-like isoform X2 [Mercenaria mercenaria]
MELNREQQKMESNHVTDNTTNNNSEERSEKMGQTPTNVHSAKDRWGKLKTTMTVTSQIQNKKQRRLDRGDSFLRKFSTRNQAELDTSEESEDKYPSGFHNPKHKTLKSCVIHPSGGLMFYWLGVVTLTVLYNLWTCIAREAFREIQKGYMAMWFCLDGMCDCIYLCDIFVQFRTGYLQQGLMVYDSSKLCKNYLKDKCFIVDLMSLLPLDFLQFYAGVHPMLRFPRFLKIYRTVRFMHMYESRTAYPNLLRVASLSHILFLGSHWFAAFYYLISEAEGFEGDWSYPKPVGHYAAVTRKYLASLYWSTLTLTTIGDLPPPDTNWQYVFVIVSYLIGVFIFATIVGQVGSVITNRNASRQEFERLLDGAKFYMQMHNVPPDLQKRVQRWYDYVWTRGRLNCNDINSLGLLPDKLKTELALHVNLGTLKKVTIFQKCRPEFLHDLMLKMRAYIFTPGDLICRRGEVAREMFIIADGVVEILGDSGTVLTQMSTGDFFGEIGILNLDGGINRRTADVRSVGYSELFVLSREDVLAALKDHPDAENIIREYGQRRLKETEEHRKMLRSAPSSPDPSAFRGNRGPNGVHTENASPGMIHFPQVKCLQKLPQMSPKLRKFFTFRNKRMKRRDIRRNSVTSENSSLNLSSNTSNQDAVTLERIHPNKTDNGMRLPVSNLDIIQEKDISDTETEIKSEQVNSTGSTRLADLVLNLLKSRRQLGYKTVNSDDADAETPFQEIQMDNINVSPEDKNASSKVNYAYNDKFEDCITRTTPGRGSQHHVLMRENAVDSRLDSNDSNTSTPKIILTPDTDGVIISSSNSDDDSDNGNSAPLSVPYLPIRNHLSRKSSPCILPLPTTLNDRTGRKFSCAPPLDLPIEVPSFSNFRGLSGNTKEISSSLDRFKSQIMQRLDTMESTNKETQLRLQETLMFQEKMMKNLLKKLSSKENIKEETVSIKSDTTIENSLKRHNSANVPIQKTNECLLNLPQTSFEAASCMPAGTLSTTNSDRKLPNRSCELSSYTSIEPSASVMINSSPSQGQDASETKRAHEVKKELRIDVGKIDEATPCDNPVRNNSESRTRINLVKDESVHNTNQSTPTESVDENLEYKVTHL